MTVSAIITTFNRASIVTRAIESVLAQTRPVDELIVVDDGSTDNTREAVSRYGPPVRYVHQSNGGLAAARNTGVREARGEWVAFLDDDDEWAPRKTEMQLEALRAAPGASLCYGGVLWLTKNGCAIVAPPIRPERLWPGMRLKSSICPCTVMVRREVFNRIGGFNERLRSGAEDWEFAVRAAPENGCAVVDAEPLAKIHEAPNSMSKNGYKMLQAELSIVDTLLVGLRGPARWAWRRRILSSMHYRRAISAIEGRQPCWKHLAQSLGYWPMPTFMPHRFKVLLVELYRKVQPRVLPGSPSQSAGKM